MAYTANTDNFAANEGGLFQRFFNWLAFVGQTAYVARGMEARAERLMQLQLKSDAELAKMGLHRDELPAHVFRDLMFT